MSDGVDKANAYIQANKDSVVPLFRNKYHMMAPLNWINDPNGFIHFRGAYHLFYQYYPYDSKWGPMHWGHARSEDLVKWTDLPVAMAPSEPYDIDGIFSGTSIEREDGNLYVLYTGNYERNDIARQVQCLAVSEDGISFKKYSGNPVMDSNIIEGIASPANFRDPKVFEKDGTFYCVTGAKLDVKLGQILLFHSEDMKHWYFHSVLIEGTPEMGNMFECPDYFNLDGKDVILCSPMSMPPRGDLYQNINSSVAFIGQLNFAEVSFKIETYHELDSGLDFYAPQTCLGPDGTTRVLVAWMQTWNRTMPPHDLDHHWAGAMTLPRQIRIIDNRLVQKPVDSIYSYLTNKRLTKNTKLKHAAYIKVTDSDHKSWKLEIGENQPIIVAYNPSEEKILVSRDKVGYEIFGTEATQLTQRNIPLYSVTDGLEVEIFLDTSSIEVFVQGKTASTTFYEGSEKQLKVFGEESLIVEVADISLDDVVSTKCCLMKKG